MRFTAGELFTVNSRIILQHTFYSFTAYSYKAYITNPNNMINLPRIYTGQVYRSVKYKKEPRNSQLYSTIDDIE